jgi:hypothetical protein
MTLFSEKAMQLPLHDARICGVDITPIDDGYLNASLEVEINPVESLELFRELGINGARLALIFQDCWQVATNLLGFATGREVISTVDIVEPSELKQKLREFNVGSATMVHFRIRGSHGSQLDFVTETILVVER